MGDSSITRTVDPFPHLIWKDVLPAADYAALDANWPALGLFTQSKSGLKWDMRAPYNNLHEDWHYFLRVWRPFLSREALNHLDVKVAGEPNMGRFMERVPGYILEPHLDQPHFTATFLFYLPREGQIEQPGAGTDLYKHNELVKEIHYTPNTLVAFPNMAKAVHGVSVPEGPNRRIYQWHMSVKETDFGL